MASKIQVRRGLKQDLPFLDSGEWGLAQDTEEIFMGLGYKNLPLLKQSDLNDIAYNVKTLGAKGDGVTSDRTALQNVFNLANSQGSVKMYFPEGTYILDGYIRVYKNTTVEFHPKAVIKRIGTTLKVFMNGEYLNTTYATGYNGDGNIHFIGGTIDLNQSTLATDKTLSAFDLGHGENISFTNLTVKNGQIGHYFQVVGCKNVRFKDCWFGDVVQSDTASTAYELIQIEAMTSAGFPSFGSYDNTISRDIFIEGCTFKNVIRAVGTHSDAGVLDENIHIRNCVFDTSYDRPLSLMTYKGCVVKDNLFLNAGADAIYLNKVTDSIIEGNTVIDSQKTGIYATSSHGNKFAHNILKNVAIASTGSYAAIRIISSNNNTFDNNTVTATTPNYTFALYTSDGSTGNRILSHQFTKGKTATISGADATEHTNIQIGNGQEVLFDGDLAAAGNLGTLTHDIRNYNFLVIMGNDNSSATATLISMVLPKSAIVIGTTSRFRLICDDSNANDRVDFSFPTGTQIQADAVLGTSHIRKVIGIV